MDSGRLSRRKKESSQHEVPPSKTKPRDELARSRNPYASTIRTVTPDPIPEGEIFATQGMEDVLLNSSPAASLRSNNTQESVRHGTRGYLVRSGSQGGDSSSMRTLQDPRVRPRTRTLEDKLRDRSPPALMMKGRHRVGSINSAGLPDNHGLEEATASIGHPSAVAPGSSHSSKSSASSRNRLVKPPPRAGSPPSHNSIHSESGPASLPTPNTRRILHLMKSTCGRMEGPLAFRRGDTNTWSLSFCRINDDSGSLVYEPKNDSSYYRTLIPDLRGCRIKTAYDQLPRIPYLRVFPYNSSLEVHLRPHTQDEYDQWFAALLSWQPIQPRGIQNKMAKPQSPIPGERRLVDSKRHSEASLLKEAPIIKVGKMVFWDTNVSYSNVGTPKSGQPPGYRLQSFGSRRWRRVSCTLRENGELKLYSETDVMLVSVVQLSQLSRSAVQRLDPSVLDNEFCIAIYPQYASTSSGSSLLRPVFLSLESRVLYEVWIVLLRAFTVPQLYGPKQPLVNHGVDLPQTQSVLATSTAETFRMERSLSVIVIEARLPPASPETAEQQPSKPPNPTAANQGQNGGYYIEVLLDGETRARTMAREDTPNPFWREDFDFHDLPAVLSAASLVLKKRPLSHVQTERNIRQQSRLMHDALGLSDGAGSNSGVSFDETLGKADIHLDDLETGKDVEKWLPLVNGFGQSAGEVLVRMRSEECVILMARDYQPMSELLHHFQNGLTLQIAQMVPGELRRLSDCLLNIFQVSGGAADWIKALVEEEIDGTLKETPASRLRFSRRMGSNDSNESFGSTSDRELIVRDMGKSAALEANLLFRGNTLVTKALDCHMKRLGKEYLEETLGDKLKEISDKDPECEVDPNRIRSEQELDRNWKMLIGLTEEVWKCISSSASRCPTELRVIFRHIRACAEDRYGDFLRTVTYSSVSGFLFLRFFCPAVLNPKLFGLLKDHPKPRARRTLTLIAKGLQGLANMTTFGAKEVWMEPMNAFLSSHRQEFKSFLENICFIPAEAQRSHGAVPASYSTPIQIISRLPPASREGFLSLPYLIDHARNFALLVQIWLEGTAASAANIQPTDGQLLEFHKLCVGLNQRTQDCLARAERAERPSSKGSFRWEDLAKQLKHATTLNPRPVQSATRDAAPSLATAKPNSAKHPPTASAMTGPTQAPASTSTPSRAPTSPADDFEEDDSTPPGSAAGTRSAGGRSVGSRSLAGSVHSTPGVDSDERGGGGGSGLSSDAEVTTALPRMLTKEEREGRAGMFGGLGMGLGMGMGRRKKREREQERQRERLREKRG